MFDRIKKRLIFFIFIMFLGHFVLNDKNEKEPEFVDFYNLHDLEVYYPEVVENQRAVFIRM